MFPELFELPIIHVTVKTYGVIMILGFLLAVFLMRKQARTIGENPDHITNAALYALLAGIIGARTFYVIHHFNSFRDEPWWSVFATWRGGLEFVGGVLLALVILILYLRRMKLSLARYMDMLAVGLMLGLAFGRIGCFFSGCCFGQPTDLTWGIRFPYGSDVYYSQIRPDNLRNRTEPRLNLPEDYFGYLGDDGKTWFWGLKPFDRLSDEQKYDVTKGQFRCLKIHPTQFYSSANAFVLCMILYLFWRKYSLLRPGSTISLMFILYGLTRFGLEFPRDDNPFESGWWTIYKNWTVSQNLGIYMAILGICSLIYFMKIKPRTSFAKGNKRTEHFKDDKQSIENTENSPKDTVNDEQPMSQKMAENELSN